ncbi:MAG: hypothetical protein KKG14_04820 [Alphaproteobacteria bacterium]|nr:hypothetical protein [Alphaproteobacteria bacterium]MBU2270516.1 hypothetical protein [Alphaproteobacteria bacterium]MBU2418006.1 hypothetical protein [Alphaproteobacteria bacterium]
MFKAPETSAPESADDPTGDQPVDAALRAAFKAVEAEAVPARLSDHMDELTAPGRKPDGRS